MRPSRAYWRSGVAARPRDSSYRHRAAHVRPHPRCLSHRYAHERVAYSCPMTIARRPSCGGSSSSRARSGSCSRSCSSSTRRASPRSRSSSAWRASARPHSSSPPCPRPTGSGASDASSAIAFAIVGVVAFVNPGDSFDALAAIFAFYLLLRGLFEVGSAMMRPHRRARLVAEPDGRDRADPARLLGRRELRPQGVPARRLGRCERARARDRSDHPRVRAPPRLGDGGGCSNARAFVVRPPRRGRSPRRSRSIPHRG